MWDADERAISMSRPRKLVSSGEPSKVREDPSRRRGCGEASTGFAMPGKKTPGRYP
jgi:hypothetical protein